MSYTKGTLRSGKDAYSVFDSSDDHEIAEHEAILPHSCGDWVIGEKENIQALIDDLQEYLNGTYKPSVID